METQKNKKVVQFLVKHIFNRELCAEVYYFLRDVGFSFEAIDKTEVSSAWMPLVEYILFDPQMYASSYPKSNFSFEELKALNSWSEGGNNFDIKPALALDLTRTKKFLSLVLKYAQHREIARDLFLLIESLGYSISYSLEEYEEVLLAWQGLARYLLFDLSLVMEDISLPFFPYTEYGKIKEWIRA